MRGVDSKGLFLKSEMSAFPFWAAIDMIWLSSASGFRRSGGITLALVVSAKVSWNRPMILSFEVMCGLSASQKETTWE